MNTKKIFLLVLFAAFLLNTAFAQKPVAAGDLNPEYTKYLELKRTGQLKMRTKDGHPLGAVPMAYTYNFDQYFNKQAGKKEYKTLAARYDLREFGYVTAVKDQQDVGVCWAFAAIGSLESTWRKMGYGTLDLSEEHMGTCNGFTSGINDGGRATMAAAYLTSLRGPVTELQVPYQNNKMSQCVSQHFEPVAYVPETRFLPNDRELIKETLVKYGALATSMNWDDNSYDRWTNTYCYQGQLPINHGVVIVGWDDDIVTACGKGAWIVKNSWGANWGDNGYFYISYNDNAFLSTVSFYPSCFTNKTTDTLYLYDNLGQVNAYRGKNGVGYGLTKYVAPAEQFVSSVITFALAAGTILDVEIYDDKNGNELSNLLGSVTNYVCDFPGYHAVDVAAVVNGDFYVKVKYTIPGAYFPIPIESKDIYLDAAPKIADGVNWILEDNEWKPFGKSIPDRENDLCIRAYSQTSSSPIAFFSSDNTQVCTGSAATFTNHSYGQITEYKWDFGESASPATANGAGPHKVTYSATGSKSVKLTVTGTSGTDTKVETIEVVGELDITLVASKTTITLGKSTTLTAIGDADTYRWTPITFLNNDTSSTVESKPDKEGIYKYTVTGKQGVCIGKDSVEISVMVAPPNDDVCKAFALKQGLNGPYINRYSSVEENEPMPVIVDCEKPFAWCDEGGLQNSVWFTFEAKETGLASFDTWGFDNQLAIYEAETCEDILNDNYTLLAANDDYYGEKKFFAAAIVKVSDLKPGKKYWLQMDGSAGGDTGTCMIYYHNWGLDINDQVGQNNNSLKIIPNPTNQQVEISFNSTDNNTVSFELYNMQGQLLRREIFEPLNRVVNQTLDLSAIPAGIYQFKVVTTNGIFAQKLIKL